ncbi:MAG: inositol phosphorylceramide synthase [Spirochaetes bacterium]|nr:inositol phosphorylceramide synthase [Spirochaetota bacterium]
MSTIFRRLPALWQNIVLGLMTMAVGMPIYTIPNIVYGERAGRSLSTALDEAIPFLPWTILGYALVYVFILLPVFTIKHRPIFIRMIVGFLVCSLIALPFFIFMPVRMPRPGIPTQENMFYWGVALNYVLDKPVNCFPSLHVANSVFATLCCIKLSPRVGFWGVVGSLFIAVSTTTLRQHFVADVLAGMAIAFATYYLVVHPAILRYSMSETPENLIFPPKTALWVFYLYLIFLGVCFLLFMMGLRFPPQLPTS